ncbi:hypothetical protein E4U15_002775 [Claviceps sp. LM218 group G6]|nr:hypothetical protein E4U15_002775 [Claviceps sp. LM218 group G6]
MPNMDFPVTPLQDFVENTSLSQRADTCSSSHGFLEGNRSFGAENIHNGGLNDGMDLFSDSNSVIAGSLGSEAFSQDASSLEVEYPQEINQQHQSRSSPTCYALNDFSMLDHRIDHRIHSHQPTQEPTWQPQSFGNSNSLVQLHQFSVQPGNTPILNLTPTSTTDYHQPLARETTQDSPNSSRSDVDGGSTESKNEKARRTLSDVTSMCKVTSMVQTCLRPDYQQFLQANLPRWVRNGLWHNNWSNSADEGTRSDRFANLQRVYSCFCQLDVRMKDDSIRSRMVMVLLHLEFEKMYHDWKCGKVELLEPMTSMGRGNISAVIDQILEKTHPEWSLAEPKQKAEFRAKFHNRKRHGKRWWMLMDTLGPSILLLCSSRFAGAMKNTTVTASMIRELPAAIHNSAPRVTQVLSVMNPIAKSLFYDRGYEKFAVDKVLAQLSALELMETNKDGQKNTAGV